MLILACVAGGSGCVRKTFCAETANSFAAKPAREFLRAANSTRLLPILLTTPAAFCTRGSGPKFARAPTPAGYAGYAHIEGKHFQADCLPPVESTDLLFYLV